MPFSSRLKTQYVRFINNKLDAIPIDSQEEINLVAQELDKIITCSFVLVIMSFFNSSSKSTLAKETQRHLARIRFYYNSPESYVSFAKDYAEYQQIIKERIQEKITELRTLTDKEKKSYVTKVQRKSSLYFNDEKSNKPDRISVYYDFEEVSLSDEEDLIVLESKQSQKESKETSTKRSCSRFC